MSKNKKKLSITQKEKICIYTFSSVNNIRQNNNWENKKSIAF